MKFDKSLPCISVVQIFANSRHCSNTLAKKNVEEAMDGPVDAVFDLFAIRCFHLLPYREPIRDRTRGKGEARTDRD